MESLFSEGIRVNSKYNEYTDSNLGLASNNENLFG